MTTRRSGYGQRIMKITHEALSDLLTSRSVIVTDFPDDTRIVDLWHTDEGWGYLIKLESSEWDELEEGQRVPLMHPTWHHVPATFLD